MFILSLGKRQREQGDQPNLGGILPGPGVSLSLEKEKNTHIGCFKCESTNTHNPTSMGLHWHYF